MARRYIREIGFENILTLEKERTYAVNESDEKDDLFEYLRKMLYLMYISDLHSCYTYSLLRPLQNLDIERYDVGQWIDLYEYLTYEKYDVSKTDMDANTIRKQLIEVLLEKQV
ncbi:MAG: hypothetical protein EOM40_15330 [Clostridia bacterium]|nr:hypothetical protein [Clostridia bacterium]NCC43583.1 hypothetical protein [Clostridia bacterium]